ncbi:MAG: PCP reductase family protein [Dehalococcoidia bacterium]
MKNQRDNRPSRELPKGRAAKELSWTSEAVARLRQVPEGVMRELTRQRVERLAKRRGEGTVTTGLVEEKYKEWACGSVNAKSEMVWSEEARQRTAHIPAFVHGMVIKAIEAYARSRGDLEITPELMEEAKHYWEETGRFHQP